MKTTNKEQYNLACERFLWSVQSCGGCQSNSLSLGRLFWLRGCRHLPLNESLQQHSSAQTRMPRETVRHSDSRQILGNWRRSPVDFSKSRREKTGRWRRTWRLCWTGYSRAFAVPSKCAWSKFCSLSPVWSFRTNSAIFWSSTAIQWVLQVGIWCDYVREHGTKGTQSLIINYQGNVDILIDVNRWELPGMYTM